LKKIVFYTEPEWAFGVIHYELTKYLFAHGVNASVMNWTNYYSLAEIAETVANVDYFVSTPFGAARLIDHGHVPPEKCIVVAHAVMDIQCLATFSPDNLARLHAYSVVSEWLVEQSLLLGIPRVPKLTPIGINYYAYYHRPSKELNTVGYAGATNPGNVHKQIKRHWLIEQAVERADLKLKAAHDYHNTWITMPGFYQSVDAVVVASTEEGAGLPALEASAAGKLVISTPVGLWLAKAGTSGHTVPIDEVAFLDEVTTLLKFYRDNPEAYQAKCRSTQAHAWQYDWSHVIIPWVELFK